MTIDPKQLTATAAKLERTIHRVMMPHSLNAGYVSLACVIRNLAEHPSDHRVREHALWTIDHVQQVFAEEREQNRAAGALTP